MLPYLSRAVGPDGPRAGRGHLRRFPEDRPKRKARAEKLANVTFVQGRRRRTPRLPENAVDVALALDSYHHYDYPAEMLAAIRRALQAGRAAGDRGVPQDGRTPCRGGYAMEHIRLDQRGRRRARSKPAGFTLVSRHEHIPGSQYVLVFVRGEAN